MEENKIIIKKSYFDNIKIAIDSINKFFVSNFKEKDFPILDSDYQIDGIILNIINWLNSVEPSWLSDTNNIDHSLNVINQKIEKRNIYDDIQDDDVLSDNVNAFIGFKMLEYIADNFDLFNQLINGIYTFDLFINSSKYKESIDKFSKPLQLYEIEDVIGDSEYTIFTANKYVTGIFNNDQIALPKSLKLDNEIDRIDHYTDLQNYEIIIDESVQEAALIDYFENSKPKHIKYDTKSNKWIISKQFRSVIDKLITDLKKCDTTTDLNELFNNENYPDPDNFLYEVTPFILVNVFGNTKKFPFDTFDVNKLTEYTDSYKSIIDNNNGAKRFQKYDLYSTFKTDKDGTISFIENFLTLELINNQSCVISNNTLLTLFNIFDSHIYYTILYNLLPDEKKKEQTVEGFIKERRSILNKTSHSANVYNEDNTKSMKSNNVQTSDTVEEFVSSELKKYKDISIQEMQLDDNYQSLLYKEISCINDKMFNRNISQIMINNYIGESYNIFQEVEDGSIPSYMKNRLELSDNAGGKPSVTDVNLPPDVPSNSVPDLSASIDAKLNAGGGLNDMLGTGYENNPNKETDGKVIYNITNNYNNSFNKDSYNQSNSNDLSTGRVTTTTTTNTNSNNDSSKNKMMDYSMRKNTVRKASTQSSMKQASNNYSNGNESSDIDDSKDKTSTLSNGVSLQEMFTFLESDEPLSDGNNAGNPPKQDLLTTAMDVDRKTLKHQQEAKRKVQKGINTGKAVLKPVARTKQWLTNIVDSLIKRDEDKVKAEIIENPSYRTALYKAGRLALKLGLFGLCFTINGYLGAAYAIIQGAKLADKQRLKKEVQEEFMAELEIIDDKIKQADEAGDLESKYKMVRLRSKMRTIVAQSPSSTISHPRNNA